MRMLMVIGVPWPLAFLGLIAASAVVSWRLIASRVFVVLLVSAGYFVTYMMTLSPEVALAEENPPFWDIARNSMMVYLPFALPALGSMISLQIEKWIEKRAKDHEEITEESLLAEKVPSAKPQDMDYDLRNIEEGRL